MASKVQIKRSSVPSKVPTTADLDLGELAINTYDGKVFLKKSVAGTESIVDLTSAGPTGQYIISSQQIFTANANQTTFSVNYTVGYVDVHLNGIKLVSGQDFTATNGSSVVLATGASAGDIVDITAGNTFSAGAGSANGIMPVELGGTGSSTASGARTNLGLSNVENKSSATIRSELTSTNVTTALGFTPYNAANPSGYISGNQTITFSGDATGSGTTGVALTLANSGVTAGTYGNANSIPQIAVDAKGRITSVTNVGVNIPSGSLTFTGDVTGTGTTGSTTTLTLANSGVTVGTYRSVTVDAKGRVTGGTNPTTLSGYGITDAQPLDSDLTAIAALAPTADNFIVGNGTTWILETPAQARASLGGTTAGQNLFTVTNPSAVTFIRINADNTVSTLDAATFRTAIGAGTSSTTGTVTSVSGTGTVSGLTLSGSVTSSGSLTLGGTLSVTPSNFSSQTANTFLAAPNGSSGTPTFRAIVAADIPTLNQNTTGTASNVTGTVAVANGGTGSTSLAANNVILGNGTSAVQTVAPGASGNILTSNGTTWTSTAPSGSSITATASGAINNGDKVIINSNGTVSAIAQILGAPTTIGTPSSEIAVDLDYNYASTDRPVAVVLLTNTTPRSFIIFHRSTAAGETTNIYATRATVSGSTITLNARFLVTSDSSTGSGVYACAIDSNRFVLLFRGHTDGYTYARAGTYDNVNGYQFGTAIQIGSITGVPYGVVYDSSASRTIAVYSDTTNSYVRAITISNVNNALTAGTEVVASSSTTYGAAVAISPTNQICIFVRYQFSVATLPGVIAGQISGGTLSFGSRITLNSSNYFSYGTSVAYSNTANRFVICYWNNPTPSTLYITSCSISGTTVSVSANTTLTTSSDAYSSLLSYDTETDNLIYVTHRFATRIKVNESSFTIDTLTNFSSTLGTAYAPIAAAYDTTSDRFLVVFSGANNTSANTVAALMTAGTLGSNLTTSNYLGISNANYSSGATATIQVDGAVDDAQSGLTPGLTYYVTNTGTLSTTNNGIKAGQALTSTNLLLQRALSGPEMNDYLGNLV